MKRFGPELDYEEKQMQFFRRMDQLGSAVFYGPSAYFPEGSAEFVREQFARFNIPLHKDYEAITIMGPALIIDLIDYRDPYLLFYDYSDISMTEDWADYTYELTEDGVHFWEAEPELLETYQYVPGQAEAFFHHYLGMPGLEALPLSLSSSIEEHLNECLSHGYYLGTAYNYDKYPCPTKIYHSLCAHHKTEDGLVNEKRVDAHFDLAVWASTLWLFGPLGREHRTVTIDVVENALIDGECIVYDGECISKEHYRKTNRPVMSCYKCGVPAWCVQMTVDDFNAPKLICEGCLSRGMRPRNGATCGTKFCKYFECPHNAYYNAGQGAVREVMRTHGQLAQRAQEKRTLVEACRQEQRMLGT